MPPITCFELESLHPAWTGSRIIALRQPLQEGLRLIRARLAEASYVLFNLISEFDFDGLLEDMTFVEGHPDRVSAEAAANHYLERGMQAVLARREGWRILQDKTLPRQVLPATGSIVPGRFPEQFASCKLGDGSAYNSMYIRTYLIERNLGCDLADQLLAYDGIREELIDFLAKLGGWQAAKADTTANSR